MKEGDIIKSFVFDPRIFISPPFIECPRCGNKTFGILGISGTTYSRRCRNCLYPSGNDPSETHELPQLNKKVIYIDQFAISNMMKALNPSTRAHQQGKIDQYYGVLFNKLYMLCQMQLIVCPDSIYHSQESLLSPFYPQLKRMYELLSGGITFKDHDTIERFQISMQAYNWLHGNPERDLELTIHSIVSGNINEWQERYIISANINYGPEFIDELRKMRTITHEGLEEVFRRWQTEKERTFDDWYEEERNAFGVSILRDYAKIMTDLALGRIQFSFDTAMSRSNIIIVTLRNIFSRDGKVCKEDVDRKIVEYLTSPHPKELPVAKIASLMYAALAHSAAHGNRKKPPSQGMANDVRAISTLMPYCDAMFIDKECHELLKFGPVAEKLKYKTRLFSLNTKQEFLDYLNDIEKSAPKEVVNAVKIVYGDIVPFDNLYTGKEND